MGLIRADINQLRATIAVLRQGKSDVQQACRQADQSMQALQSGPWSGNHRVQAEAAWERIAAQFTPLIEALETLINRTERFTNNLEEAGQQFSDGTSVSGSVGRPIPDPTPVPTPVPTPSPTPEPATPRLDLPPYQPFTPGQTDVPGVLQNTAGCTNYVLRRVNLNDMGRWPDAHLWNDAARAANYVVDSRPAAGAVMVFEPGVMGASSGGGHVAYVERVERGENGQIKITISEANVAYDSQGNVLWGTHTPPSTREILVKESPDGALTYPDGRPLQGVSFILGRRA